MNVSILIKFQHPTGTSVSTARKRSLGQGNVFTGVCLSTGGLCPSMHHRSLDQGVCPGGSLSMGLCPVGSLPWGGLCPGGLCLGVSVQGGLCPGRVSVRETPWTETHPVWSQAGSMHPTGMHSCLCLKMTVTVNSVSHLLCKYIGISFFLSHADSTSDKLHDKLILAQNMYFSVII